jgi:hypothetical protein
MGFLEGVAGRYGPVSPARARLGGLRSRPGPASPPLRSPGRPVPFSLRGSPRNYPTRGCSASVVRPRKRGFPHVGAWRSLVAHLHGVQGVGGSNPLAPTIPLVGGQELAEAIRTRARSGFLVRLPPNSAEAYPWLMGSLATNDLRSLNRRPTTNSAVPPVRKVRDATNRAGGTVWYPEFQGLGHSLEPLGSYEAMLRFGSVCEFAETVMQQRGALPSPAATKRPAAGPVPRRPSPRSRATPVRTTRRPCCPMCARRRRAARCIVS